VRILAYLQMPGSVPPAIELDTSRWYRANTPGAASPEGYGEGNAINAIWENRTDSQRPSQTSGAQVP
jgi:hypothetical protein